jgi:hypothetical protein
MPRNPTEDDPRLADLIRKAKLEAEESTRAFAGRLGYCHMLWINQKRILRDKYGIDWKTPAEMNPEADID